MRRPYSPRVLAHLAACCWIVAATLSAQAAVTDVLGAAVLGDLKPQLQALGPALAKTVASTYPVASASSSLVYRYDPAREAFVRSSGPLGPLFGERARTIGAGRADIALSYSYVSLDVIDGASFSSLENRARVKGNFLTVGTGGERLILADGRYTEFLPQRTTLDLDVDASIVALNATYGLSPAWDVNVFMPFVRSSLRFAVSGVIPDSRFPEFSLAADQTAPSPLEGSQSDSSFGVGDLLLRTKYVVHRREPLDLAVGLTLGLPTGDDEDLHGTGTWRVEPALIASRLFDGRWEPFINAAMAFDTKDVSRSVVRWVVGINAAVWEPITTAVAVLGRHDLSAQTDQIDVPFFFQIERSDQYDLALTGRWLATPNFVASINALIPLNEDGVRAGLIPTVQLEYVF